MNEYCRTKEIREYQTACNSLADLFCKKHDFPTTGSAFTYWSDRACGVLLVNDGDYAVDMATIITDIEDEVDEEEFINWYEYNHCCAECQLQTMNFSSWAKGAPRIPQEAIDNIYKAKADFEQAIEEAKKQSKIF